MKRTTKLGLACAASAACIQLTLNPVQAGSLAYEGFNYTEAEGTSITGLNGGTGFIEAYPSVNAIVLTNTGPSYPGVYTVGKAIRYGANANMGNGGRNWSATLADGTYWYSFMVHPFSTGGTQPGRGTFCPLMDNGNQNGFGMRLDNSSGSPQFKAWTPQQSAGANLNFSGGYDQSYVVIGRAVINKSGTSENTIWVFQNPTALPATEGELTGGSTATSDPAQAANLGAAIGGRAFSDSSPIVYDEVRVGTTYADVLPPSGPSVIFGVNPSSAVENQTLALSWANIPAGFTAVELDPGNIDVTGLTDAAGSGQTTIEAPAVDTEYVLTYTVGGVNTSVTNQFTAVAPWFTITPTNGWELDELTFNWRVPVGSSAVSISPGVGDVTFVTSATDGRGTTGGFFAPGSDETYVLSYTYNMTTVTLTQYFTLAAPFVRVTPQDAVENVTELTVNWRIPPGATAVSLEYGPENGPFAVWDVTFNTDATGAGSLSPLFPSLTDTHYNLRYTNGGTGYVLSTNINVYPQIFTGLVASGNAKPVIINPQPMKDGVVAYSDRGHVWAAVPSILQGAQFVKFGQDDKTAAALQVTFTAATNATFFLLLDNRVGDGVGGNNPVAGTDNPPTLTSVMTWVLGSGFVDSGVDIGLDENPVAGTNTIDQSYSVFFRQVSAGETFTFYEQNDGSTRNMYGVAGVAPQVVPVAFVAIPNQLTEGESTTLQWTVPVGSTVNIDNGVGDVTPLTDAFGVGSTIVFPPVGTNSYTLTYDPPGANTPPVNLGPVAVIVESSIADYPTNISYSVTAGNITMEWPLTHLGWVLQSQTNALSTGLSSNWEDVPGSEAVNSASFPIDSAVPVQFFRLRKP